jgi:ABC-type multidrug transport system ATPase subunit
MKITLNQIGKRYNRDWIFRNVSLEFQSGNKYAVLGPNGSGKSTLLQTIAGNLIASEGNIIYNLENWRIGKIENKNSATSEKIIIAENVYQHLAICAPYLQLIEEFTLKEMIDFHVKFKPLAGQLDTEKAIEILALSHASEKQIRHFSSGMKQRVKLGLAILSEVPLLILDEPLTNLDDNGKNWYYHLIESYTNNKTILVGSNRHDEYAFAEKRISIGDYK